MYDCTCFNKEIALIKNKSIRDFASICIQFVPKYFFEIPASSSGKYHPSYALGEGGLVRHTKAAIAIAQEFLKLEMYLNFFRRS